MIDTQRHRATITENCFIDKALKNIHAQADDGSLFHKENEACRRCRTFDFNPREVLAWDLPYELVVVAVRRENDPEDTETTEEEDADSPDT